MNLETRYRVFKIVRLASTHHDVYHHILEGCSAEQYMTEDDAKAWILQHGDFRNAQFEYVIMPCLKAVKK